MGESYTRRRFFLKVAIQQLAPTVPGIAYWLYVVQRREALFPGHCFEHHSPTLIAGGGGADAVDFRMPFTLKLRKEKTKWQRNTLSIAVHEGRRPGDPECLRSTFHLNLTDLYDLCVDGVYTFRQSLRSNLHLTFSCERVYPPADQLLAAPPPPLPGVAGPPGAGPTDPRGATADQQLALMFPALAPEVIADVLACCPDPEEAIDRLLALQTPGAPLDRPASSTAAEADDVPALPVLHPPPEAAPLRVPFCQSPLAPPTGTEGEPPLPSDPRPDPDPDPHAALCRAVQAELPGVSTPEARAALGHTDWAVDPAVRLLVLQRLELPLPPPELLTPDPPPPSDSPTDRQ